MRVQSEGSSRCEVGEVWCDCENVEAALRFPRPDRIYSRVVENPKAPLKTRIAALEAIQRPSMRLLYRLVSDPKIPAKLYALAAKKYEFEFSRMELRKRARQRQPDPNRK